VARPQAVSDDDVIAGLARVFRDVGYEGASMAELSAATGLQKASLYHRFPGGKRQMADEVLAAASAWFADNVLRPLNGDGPPAERLAAAIRSLNDFYEGGSRACLLNMLSSPRIEDGPFSQAIKTSLEALVDAFARLCAAAGWRTKQARRQAERMVTMLQGSLVLSRGTGSTAPFRNFLADLPSEILDRDSD
jgi:AcrR family transcriptional regulator